MSETTDNNVAQLLNSVRLARDNAQRADNRIDHSFYYALSIALEELQEHHRAAALRERAVGAHSAGQGIWRRVVARESLRRRVYAGVRAADVDGCGIGVHTVAWADEHIPAVG